MPHAHSNEDTHTRFFSPALSLLESCDSHRSCPALPDDKWIELGVSRVILAPDSGRGFLQDLVSRGKYAPGGGHFFETLKSQRRLSLCAELSEKLARKIEAQLPDALADFECLKNFEVRAGDGHWHGAASFDSKKLSKINNDGSKVYKRYPVGHLYTMDLRSHAMRHLITSDQDKKRKEHDMAGLKRAGARALKEGIKTGRKLLMVWDSAAIDFSYWHKLKQGSGIYFLCREKNVKRVACGDRIWDRDDVINTGVISDKQVGSSTQGHLVRVIEFCDESTGKNHRFITNEMTLPPGVLAHLYRMRWDIEKAFDEIKNRLNQKKAWATSTGAKSMQGHFIAMTHNLMLLLDQQLREKEGITNEPDQKRRIARRAEEGQKAGRLNESLALRDWLHRSTQRGLKFIRWLRAQLVQKTSWRKSCEALNTLYSRL